MKINPMLKKELKLSVRSPRLSVLLIVFNAVLFLFGIGIVFFIKTASTWTGQINFRYNIYMYIFMAAMEFLLLLFIVPTITAGLIASEREKQTLDILLTSGMTPYQIILGKLMSAAGSILMIIFSGLPIVGIALIYGGIGFDDILMTLIFLVFSTFYIGSIGIFCSSLFKKTTFSSLLTYGIELVLIIGPVLFVLFATYIQKIRTNYISMDIGILAVLLLLSPAVTFAYLLLDQTASLANVNSWLTRAGLPAFVSEHFVIISLFLQCIFICIFVRLAVYYLKERNQKKPLRRRS